VRPRSLRLRLAAGAAATIVVALLVVGFSLVVLFGRHADRAQMSDLDVHLRQLGAGVEIDPSGRLVVTRPPADPRFSDPMSGLYWQAQDDADGLVRSRSLWQTTIAPSDDRLEPGKVSYYKAAGPANQDLFAIERLIRLPAGAGERSVRITAAADRERIETARSDFSIDLVPSLALLALTLGAASWIQIGMGLKPLDAIRREVADIRAGAKDRLPENFPSEVSPFVDEVNALLEAQRQDMVRARDRAADLAHGLTPPLVALATEVRVLRENGELELASNLRDVAETMCRHVDRELVRARVRQLAWPPSAARTDLRPIVDGLVTTLVRTPEGSNVDFRLDVREKVGVACDPIDLTEVLGNLLENAARYAQHVVRVTAAESNGVTRIEVEDDGPGVPTESRAVIVQRGRRLDESGSAGLGLAIVQDVLEAYNWTLELGTSVLGGLKVTIGPRLEARAGKRLNSAAADR
jgi:signal transduction histidine kinase